MHIAHMIRWRALHAAYDPNLELITMSVTTNSPNLPPKATFKARCILVMVRWAIAVPSVYSTLIHPHFEYTMQTFSPNLAANANWYERIQGLAMRFIKVCTS